MPSSPSKTQLWVLCPAWRYYFFENKAVTKQLERKRRRARWESTRESAWWSQGFSKSDL